MCYTNYNGKNNRNSIESKSRYKVINNAKLSINSINVLNSAFNSTYDNDPNYTNMYNLSNGQKAMDWWNFPWDLKSSKPQYQITYGDMRDILTNVLVKMEKNDLYYVKYSNKLANNVMKLNPTIMNNHGGYLRVIKIIYCIRNFMTVAIKHHLIDDINNLRLAIIHLLSINKHALFSDPNPLNLTYGSDSAYHPLNIDGISENRTHNNGLNELKIYL